MAREFKPVIFSDMDNSDDPQPIPDNQVAEAELSYNGKTVHLDLTKKEEEKLARDLAPYLERGKKVTKRSATKSRGSSDGRTPKQRAEVRRWAQENSMDIGDRGRIPQSIYDAYDAAH
ncbi:MAG: histone-like nucleoid-structuring protein Lsr2 [Leucobacter sp.]